MGRPGPDPGHEAHDGTERRTPLDRCRPGGPGARHDGAGGSPRRRHCQGASRPRGGRRQPHALPGFAPRRRAVVAAQPRPVGSVLPWSLRTPRLRHGGECALGVGQLDFLRRAAGTQFRSRPSRTRSQHRRAVRPAPTWQGAAHHGDAPERSRVRLPVGAPTRCLRDGRGQGQWCPRHACRLGGDGLQCPQGLRGARPAVSHLLGPARTEITHRPARRGPARAPLAAGTRPPGRRRRARTGRTGGRRRFRRQWAAVPSRPHRMAAPPPPGGRHRLGRHPRLAPTPHGGGVRTGPDHRRVVGYHVYRDRMRAALYGRRHSGGHATPDPAAPPALCRRPARSDHGARTRRAVVARPAGDGPDRLHASGRLRRGTPGTARRAGRRKVDGRDRARRHGRAGREDRDCDGPGLQVARSRRASTFPGPTCRSPP